MTLLFSFCVSPNYTPQLAKAYTDNLERIAVTRIPMVFAIFIGREQNDFPGDIVAVDTTSEHFVACLPCEAIARQSATNSLVMCHEAQLKCVMIFFNFASNFILLASHAMMSIPVH